jgi:hypothetical protein
LEEMATGEVHGACIDCVVETKLGLLIQRLNGTLLDRILPFVTGVN